MIIESRSKRVRSGNKKPGKNEEFQFMWHSKEEALFCVTQIKNKRKNTQINKKWKKNTLRHKN